MKKTLITILAVLFIACFMKMNFFISPASQVNAQPPRQEREEPLPIAIKRFMEQHADQARRPHQEQERELDHQKHQIENLHIAAKHLEEAGAHDLAHQIHQEAEHREKALREHFNKTRHREHASHQQQETQELLHKMNKELHQLKMEVHELREVISQRLPRPEK